MKASGSLAPVWDRPADVDALTKADMPAREITFPRVLKPILVLAVAALPLEVPRMSSQATPADAGMILFILIGGASLWRTRARLRLPLAGSYTLLLLGGLVALSQSLVPGHSAAALVIDFYLFIWFFVAMNVFSNSEGALRTAAFTWSLTAVAEALYMGAAHLRFPKHVPYFFGNAPTSDFNRTNGTFFDPNLAGFYLVVSLFILWAAPKPASRKVKVLLTIPLVYGVYATQSITALATIVAGTLVALTIAFISRRELATAIVLGLIAALLVTVSVLPDTFGQKPAEILNSLGRTRSFSGTLGRSENSFGGRAQRWLEAIHFFGGNMLIGIGPAATDDSLAFYRAPIGGELHNDYIAGFLERGVVGGVGVLAIFGVATAWAIRAATSRRVRARGWRAPALLGAMAAALLTAMTLETLHFRLLWLFFALVVGIASVRADTLPDRSSARVAG